MSAPGNERTPALLVSIRDAANTLGLGRTKLYLLFDEGQLSYVKIGRRRLVESAELARFVASLRAEPVKQAAK